MSTTGKNKSWIDALAEFIAYIVGAAIGVFSGAFLFWLTSDDMHEMFPAFPDMSFGQALTFTVFLFTFGSYFYTVRKTQ